MEARRYCAAIVVSWLAMAGNGVLHAASDRSANFIVNAPTREFATEVAQMAEQYRRDLAIEWLGQELPRWHQPCPITVRVGEGMGAGGATSFMFDRGRPFGWRMSIQGSQERILDSVLPHEVTHTVFATYFGRPLPRWADEGACTSVEHDSEKKKQVTMLNQFLRSKPSRGIPFNRMYAMREYPSDIMPLYSQGFSLVRYLLYQGGKRKFVEYLGEGMQRENWDAVTQKYYSHRDLSELQLAWVDWVAAGSPNAPDRSHIASQSPQLPTDGGRPFKIARATSIQPLAEPRPIADVRGFERTPPGQFTEPSDLNPLHDDRHPPQATALANQATYPSDVRPSDVRPSDVTQQAAATSRAYLSSDEVVTRGQDAAEDSWYARQRDRFRDSSIFSIGRKTDGRRVAFSSFASLSARTRSIVPPPKSQPDFVVLPVNLDDPVPPPPPRKGDEDLLARPLVELGPATKIVVRTSPLMQAPVTEGPVTEGPASQTPLPAMPIWMDPVQRPSSQSGTIWR